MSKKEKPKKDRKKAGKKNKANKANLKTPSKKVAGKKVKKPKIRLKGMRASREPQDVDFSTITVDAALRERVYRRHDSTPRETNHMNKALNCVMRAANVWGMRTGGADQAHAFSKTRYWTLPDHTIVAIDLATFVAVAESAELQREVSKLMGRSSFMGPVGITALRTFVVTAKQLVLADAQATSSS